MKKFIILFSLVYVFFIPNAQAMPHLPAGGYLQSCNQCSMSRNTLSCQCESRRGNVKSTSLHVRPNCGEIENNNGNLHCLASGASGEVDRDHGDRSRRRSFDVNAGKIWNQSDAERKCPRICRREEAKWTGDWRSGRRGNSVCACQARGRDRNQDSLPFNIKF